MGHYSEYFEQEREDKEKERFLHLKTMLDESIVKDIVRDE